MNEASLSPGMGQGGLESIPPPLSCSRGKDSKDKQKRRRGSPRPPSDPLGPANRSGTGKYELGQRQQRPRRMKPPGMGLSMGTGVRPAGGLQDIDDGLICCASLLKGGKQMTVLHETLRVGERP